jgi:aminoglycoside/choline kinase family phosphotransferase
MLTDTDTPADSRLSALTFWLRDGLRLPVSAVVPASADASFRRYFRIQLPSQTLIAMDAPPDREDSAPFVKVCRALKAIDVPVPDLLEADLDQGFLLLSDLGSTHLLGTLREGAEPDRAYAPAAAALLRMQHAGGRAADELPPYDEALLRREMDLFPVWFLERHLGLVLDQTMKAVLERTACLLCDSALQQPQVFVHRDYHSRNLMVPSPDSVGVIDFQDAVRGPVTYDLVSLYKDCYVEWPRPRALEWVESHRQALLELGLAVADREEFQRSFDWMGLQRHLKVLGIFARLWYRDGKPGYLADLPLVLRYVMDVTDRYAALRDLNTLLRDVVMPRFAAAQMAVIAT